MCLKAPTVFMKSKILLGITHFADRAQLLERYLETICATAHLIEVIFIKFWLNLMQVF